MHQPRILVSHALYHFLDPTPRASRTTQQAHKLYKNEPSDDTVALSWPRAFSKSTDKQGATAAGSEK